MTMDPKRTALLPGRGAAPSGPMAALDYEIAQERASALGRLGRALETSLAALSEYEGADVDSRSALVQAASEALWLLMVQREACGLRDPRSVIRDYRVPAEVYARMGAFRRR